MGLIALLLIGWHLLRIALATFRARRSGRDRTIVNAHATAALIGLGASLGGAMAGSAAIRSGLERWWFPPVFGLLVQVAGALLLSFVVARLYAQVLIRPLRTWFAAGEARKHAG